MGTMGLAVAEQSTPSHISPTCIRTSFSEDPDGTSRAMDFFTFLLVSELLMQIHCNLLFLRVGEMSLVEPPFSHWEDYHTEDRHRKVAMHLLVVWGGQPLKQQQQLSPFDVLITAVFRLVVQKSRRESAHAQNFQFKIPTKRARMPGFSSRFLDMVVSQL